MHIHSFKGSMKIGRLFVPSLGWALEEDTSTLLSLKISASMETGVEQLLDMVGSRNVTQMSSLLQNLVAEQIEIGESAGEPYTLDADVSAALTVIKNELLEDIRASLKEAHKSDQIALHTQLECFDHCDDTRRKTSIECDARGANALQYCSEHYYCRLGVKEKYLAHIAECRELDSWVMNFHCPIKIDEKCVYDSPYICHECEATFTGMRSQFGAWLGQQVAFFEMSYATWQTQYQKCHAAYQQFMEHDAECDLVQRKCEEHTCLHGSCEWFSCPVEYTQCRANCIAEYHATNKEKECLEKDRKIDWSATEKIECYVDILLAKPTPEDLQAKCGTPDCYNKWREIMYKECEKVCPEIDFETGSYSEHDRREAMDGTYTRHEADIDVTNEGTNLGVNTTHRGEGENRCTAHLDLDFQKIPCALPCPPPPPTPCTDEFVEWHYGRHGFLSEDILGGLQDKTICHDGEHTAKWGHNLCECQECDPLVGTVAIPLGTDDYCPTPTTTTGDYVTTAPPATTVPPAYTTPPPAY
jgi:hypothetical protein